MSETSKQPEISQEAARKMLDALQALVTESSIYLQDPSDPSLISNMRRLIFRGHEAVRRASGIEG